jgi:NAD(P)-dependent dehydrogenase (short-subunit alcohol dehydrogenase family)
MAKWTASDVPDQSGRRAVVTGANSGLGLNVARELARAGARVVMAVRDTTKGAAALERLRREVPGADAQVRALDLADLESVRAFASGIDEPVDLLVNNAGVMALPHRRTRDGFEMQLGTNHLGHFALTGLLLPRLLNRSRDGGDDARVVTVSSGAHRMGRMNWNDLQSERRYQRWLAYGQSKLANLLFTLELQRRADAAGAPLRSVAAHPGYAATNLQFQSAQMEGSALKARVNALGNRLFAQSDEQGALPLLYAATTDLPGGAFAGPDGRGEMRGHPRLVGMSGRASDPDAARRLWEVSQQLTGVTFELAPTSV